MPLVVQSSYRKRPFFLFNGHLETIVPSMFYKEEGVKYQRERIELDDGDFLDLDWLKGGFDKLLVLSHGLEGSSDRHYIVRAAKYFHKKGWDVLAWNCRSCSGEPNRLPRFYHHGATEDLGYVLDHALDTDQYQNAVLMGYSMGGSMSIKYLGERTNYDPRVSGAVTFSVPCSLGDSGDQLKLRSNRIYEKRFVEKLKTKVKLKAEKYPGVIDATGVDLIDDFDAFHDKYTVPLNGFEDMDDFYSQSTCDQYLMNLRVPVLIGNALNDPLLGPRCYPTSIAQNSSMVYLDMPAHGGHVGFTQPGKQFSWMEERGADFIDEVLLPD